MKPEKHYVLKTGKSLTIRPAIPTDAEELIALVHALSGESDNLTFGAGEFDIGLEAEKTLIQQFLNAINQLLIVAIVDGKIVGDLSFRAGERPRIAHVGEFGIGVSKAYWGQGIGQHMIQYLIDWARSTNRIRKINLRSRTDNTNAIALYKKMGFIEEGVLMRDFYIDGEFYDSLCMGLMLD